MRALEHAIVQAGIVYGCAYLRPDRILELLAELIGLEGDAVGLDGRSSD